MPSNWRSKTQFRRLAGDLANRDGPDFERRVLHYLRMLHSDVALQAAKSMDHAGIDLFIPGPEGTYTLFVQCKGFQVADEEVGSAQIRQCEHSISSFASSGMQSTRYWMVHNKRQSGGKLNQRLGPQIEKLRKAAKAEEALLLDSDSFLERIVEELYDRFKAHLGFSMERWRNSCTEFLGQPSVTVTEIPYRRSFYNVNQYGFANDRRPTTQFADPLPDLAANTRYHLLLGEFGMGKTTQALRLAYAHGDDVMFVPAAALPTGINGSSDMAYYLTDAKNFLETFDSVYWEELKRLLRVMSEKLLSQNDANFVIIIDGLDESPFLTVRDGLPALLDHLSKYRSRVVLTMRTEFWHLRRQSLLAAYADRPRPTTRSVKNRSLREIELLPWDSESMMGLLNGRIKSARKAQRKHLEELGELIRSGRYTSFYGDIPQRPLLLHMLLDFVVRNGIAETSLVSLFEEWITNKITRDRMNPLAIEGQNRVGIRSEREALDEISRLVWRCMEEAACAMTDYQEGNFIILPDCTYSNLAARVPALRDEPDPIGLTLNSLLLASSNARDCVLRFAHRAFQEYFLGRAIHSGRFKVAADVKLPEEIAQWLTRLAAPCGEGR